MITYELAKELKEAGFPQEDRHFYYSTHTDPPTRWDVNVLDDLEIPVGHMFAAPTLEEIIEACDKDFQSLERIVRSKDGTLARTEHGEKGTQYWRARPTMIGYTARPHGGECSTPTEAVARLWLALNPKKI